MKNLLALLLFLLAGPALALGPYSNVVLDESGNGVAAVNVTVYLADTVTLASLYSDNGTTPIANPLTTDYAGRFEFWAANGLYDVCYSKTGIEPWCDENEKIIDAGHVGAPSFNVTDNRFGAVSGDDLDDSAAFQACLDSLEAQGGGTMVVPAGGVFDVDLSVDLPSNVTITGGGMVRNGITLEGYVNGAMFSAHDRENITISDIAFDGQHTSLTYNGSGYPGTVTIRACSNVKILDCHFYDCGADGVLIAGWDTDDYCENVIINGSTFERCYRDGVAIVACDGVTVSDCHFIDILGQAIDIEPNTGQSFVDNFVISGNVIESSLGAESETVAGHWNQAIGISSVDVVVGHGTVTGNTISYLFPDAYLATAAATARYPNVVAVAGVLGPLVFSDNSIVTNRLSDIEGNYGVVTFWNVINGLVYTGNSIYRPETTPAAADGEGHALWKALAVLGSDGYEPKSITLSGSIKGSFNTPLWVNGCDDVAINMQIENTANSISANVTGAAFIRKCNDVRLTGSYSTPDNVIVLDAVDGLVATGAILKSSAAGVMVRNQGAASGVVAFIGCAVSNNSAGLGFPSAVMARNNDGNAIATWNEALTVDLEP